MRLLIAIVLLITASMLTAGTAEARGRKLFRRSREKANNSRIYTRQSYAPYRRQYAPVRRVMRSVRYAAAACST